MGGLPKPLVIFLFFLILVLGITSAYLPPLIATIVAILLIAAGVMVFASTRRVATLTSASKATEGELEKIVSVIDDALIAYDAEFVIRFFNPAAERLFGFSAGEIVGKKIKPQDAEDGQKQVFVQVMFPSLAPRMITREGRDHAQIADLSFENPTLEVRVVTAELAGNEGEKKIFLKIVKNRTREISFIRSKNEFVTIASHQLRTPVSEVGWALETLAKDQAIAGDSRTLLEKAQASAARLGSLVEDLLNISRIEEGRFGYDFAGTDIVEFLGGIAGQALPQAEHAGIKLYFDRPQAPLPTTMIDAQKLSMVVANLLDNAIRYNTENGEVVLGVKQSEGKPYVEVSVRDSGIGIPAEEVEKLFTKFFRASNALKFQTEGSGLGLYIAKNIIEAHGGTLRVESELNRGTTVTFTLPTDPSLVPRSEATIE